MKKIFIIVLFIAVICSYSQIFTDINAGLPEYNYPDGTTSSWGDYDNDGDLDVLLVGFYFSGIYRNDSGVFHNSNVDLTSLKLDNNASAWGDYDNDGDLDIFITGGYAVYVSEGVWDWHTANFFYRNDGGSFTQINTGIIPVSDASVAWSDYDNDGDLDILITGVTIDNTYTSKIYRNDFGIFTDIDAGLIGIGNGDAVWGDYDNDGDLDILLAGNSTKIYNNNSGIFTDINAGLPGVQYSSADWGDYDNDGDLDILLTGARGSSIYISEVYRNDSGVFTVINAGLPGVWTSSGKWGDYDNDGDLDILLSGWASPSLTKVYRNDAGVFTDINAGLPGVQWSSADWGDYNNDGYLDILLTGYNSDDQIAKIYKYVPEAAFVSINAGLAGVYYSSVDWGDYDSDGDLDILLMGVIPYMSKIYRNNGNGTFTDIAAGLTGVAYGSAEWGDYDNDGDLDVLLSGGYEDTSYQWHTLSKIYRNDSGTFTDIAAGLAGAAYGSAEWGDYDNDGYLDILLCGSGISKIYRNDSGIFIDIAAGLSGLVGGSAVWGDYDNDGDLDILLSGESSSVMVSKIYRNDSGTFTDIIAGLMGAWIGSVAWGDYDNDGDLDILLTGEYEDTSSQWHRISKIYRNDSGIFIDINAGLIGVWGGSGVWGDYDNDGDLDILLTGDTGSAYVSKVYKNIDCVFTDINAEIIQVSESSVAWGDYDKDGDLDILLTGKTSTNSGVTELYKNTIKVVNHKPVSPANLSTDYTENGIVLSWDKATDAETPQDGLSYNIYIGSTSQTENIYSPMSDIFTGNRKIVSIGNANQNTSWTIKNLPTGEYYWSVQTIDHAFAGSEFASEQYFTSIEDNIVPLTTELYQNYPNPFNPTTSIKYSLSNDAHVKLIVYDITGREVTELVNQKKDKGFHEANFNAERLTSGMYFYRLSVDNKVVASKKMMMLK